MRTAFILTAFFLQSLFLPGCMKKNDGPNQPERIVRGKMSGAPFECTSVTYNITPAWPNTTHFSFLGYFPGGMMDLRIGQSNPITAGAYTLDNASSYYISIQQGTNYPYVAGAWPPGQPVGSGQIIISEFNNDHISGSFLFTGIHIISQSPITVSEGYFYIER